MPDVKEDDKFIYGADGVKYAKGYITPEQEKAIRGGAAPKDQTDEFLAGQSNAASHVLPYSPTELVTGLGAAARDGVSWLSKNTLLPDVEPSNKGKLRDALYPTTARFTDQGRQDFRAMETGQQQGSLQQNAPPEYLARPGTPQGMVQQSVMGSARPGVATGGGGGGLGTKDLEKAYGAQMQAQQSAYEAGQQKAAEAAGFHQQALQEAQAQEQKRQAFEQRATQLRDEQMQKIQTINDNLSKMDTRVDPKHYWADKTTGERMTAALAVFLGGLGNGPNQALNIIDTAVSRDIAAQQQNIENARAKGKDALEGAKGLYGMMLTNLGDERAATAATSAAAKELFLQRLGALDAKYMAPEQKAAMEAAKGKLQESLAKDKLSLQQWTADYGLKKAGLEMQKAELAAKLLGGKGGGQTLPAGEAGNLAQLQTAKGMLTDLSSAWDKKTGAFSFLTKHIPGFDSQRYGNDKLAAAQAIGSILEGGKLTEGDLNDKYLPLMPDASDNKTTKEQKLESLNTILEKNYAGRRQGFENAGYNVSAFPRGTSTFKPD